MFPSFTGSARPKRQVNLSGRNSNPFASPGTRAPQAPQTAQNALAQAQQDRLLRQHERERPPAATKIQKTWRGHTVRSDLARDCRRQWDKQEQREKISGLTGRYIDENECLSQLKLLNRFSASHGEDIKRLHHFAQKYMATVHIQHFQGLQWTHPRLVLAKKVMSSLSSMAGDSLPSTVPYDFLILLESLATDVAPALVRKILPLYYLHIVIVCITCTLLLFSVAHVGWTVLRSSPDSFFA